MNIIHTYRDVQLCANIFQQHIEKNTFPYSVFTNSIMVYPLIKYQEIIQGGCTMVLQEILYETGLVNADMYNGKIWIYVS